MNLFLTNIRRQNLKLVNCVCSQPLNDSFKSTIPINRLRYYKFLAFIVLIFRTISINLNFFRQHGFSVYLVDTIRAPEAIVRYLCKTYRIHNIPIGDHHTYLHNDNVPSDITNFFSGNKLKLRFF